jgi:hypothetical protein
MKKGLISIEEFESKVAFGEQLCILDDMVLDVKGFGFSHPGGEHVIKHNIGRDISKFFYGGYVLSNDSNEAPYKHSNIARITVNNMIKGVLYNHSQMTICNINEKYDINQTTKFVSFKSHNGEKMAGVRDWYWDISMFGKHYLVWNYNDNTPSKWAKRHYTISNCLREEFYEQMMKAVRARSSHFRSSVNDND